MTQLYLLPSEAPIWRTALIDPPWPENGGGQYQRGANAHYTTQRVSAMPSIIRGSGLWKPYPDAHLWMWATTNYLPDAVWLGAQLGFEYKTGLIWCKTDEDGVAEPAARMGLGQYLRMEHEHLLLFTRGSGMDPSVWTGARNVRSVIYAPRGEHSEKPDESYRRITSVSRGPYVELFARRRWADDWTVWGFDAPEVDGVKAQR